jgi:hypothetical protein
MLCIPAAVLYRNLMGNSEENDEEIMEGCSVFQLQYCTEI